VSGVDGGGPDNQAARSMDGKQPELISCAPTP